MGEIEKTCKGVLDRVPGSIACGIIDLGGKKVVEVHHPFQFPPEQRDVTTSAMVRLFCGEHTVKLAETVRNQLEIPKNDKADLQEIQIFFDQAFYLGKKIKNGGAAVLLVTKKDDNIGLAWEELKAMIPIVETLIP